MANRVETQKLIDNNRRTLIKYVIFADGTATANATLIKFGDLNYAINATGYVTATDPQAEYGVSIKRIYGYSKIQNAGGYITLKWENDSNSEIIAFGSNDIDIDMTGVTGDGAVITSPVANAVGLIYSAASPTSGDVINLFVDMKKDGSDFDQGQSADPAAFNYGSWSLS